MAVRAPHPTPAPIAATSDDELRLEETVVCTSELRWFSQDSAELPRLQQGYRVISGPREGMIYWVDVPTVIGVSRELT
jgi:hypothetical protein